MLVSTLKLCTALVGKVDFDKMDADGDGVVSKDELADALVSLDSSTCMLGKCFLLLLFARTGILCRRLPQRRVRHNLGLCTSAVIF